jgi:Exonuclease
MPPEVTKINGITDAMLKGQPDAAGALPDFLRFIGDSVLIAHNAPFDISFINEELARIGKPALRNKVIDTRIFAKEMFPDLPKYALQELAVRFGMELFLVCLKRLRDKLGMQASQIGAATNSGQASSGLPASTTAQVTVAHDGTRVTAQPALKILEDIEQEDLFGDEFGEEGDFSEESPE